LTVYDKRNKELYKTSAISTGASGDDYNTVTCVDSDGAIKNGAGNNSTPAGMYEVSGRGTYHGYPSFTRRRVGSDGKGIEGDDIASSFHYGNVSNKKASNGCVRVGGEELNELRKYMTEGTMTYTLPEKEGSRFVLRGGKLNFVADNPYGNTTGDKKYWDDYNTTVNKEYKSLLIAPNEETGNAEYDGNVIKACNAIGVNKRAIQKKLGLSSDEYNRIAQLTMGILEQESKYGTAIRYKAKQALVGMFGTLPQQLGHVGRWMVSGFKAPHKVGSSVGIGQIKAEDDFKNEGLANLYNWAKIDRASDFESPDKGALAVMLRLGYIYNTEVKGRSFKKRGGQDMDKYDALLYAYNGRSKHARNGNAKPEKSEYLNNVKNNSKRFTYLESNDE